MTDDLNPFDDAVSCGAIYAAVYQECGADGLRYMLDGMVAGIFDDVEGRPFFCQSRKLGAGRRGINGYWLAPCRGDANGGG